MAEAPPSYEEAVGPYAKATSNVEFQDFWPYCPNQQRKAKYADFETFGHLIRKANTWLGHNPMYRTFCCETVEKKVYLTEEVHSPATLTFTSGQSAVIVKGLRLWLHGNKTKEPQRLEYADYLPRVLPYSGHDDWGGMEPEYQYESLRHVMDRFNMRQKASPVEGSILCMNTVFVCVPRGAFSPDHVDTNRCTWQDTYKAHKLQFLRIFIETGIPEKEQLGMADFMPDMVNDADGPCYAGFGTVMQKVTNWLKTTTNIRVTNLQTLPTKSWKHARPQSIDTMNPYEYKCEKTPRVRFLRVYYTLYGGEGSPAFIMPPVTHHNFYPAPRSESSESSVYFEDIWDTRRRMRMWLNLAKAPVLCVETVHKIGKPKHICRELNSREDHSVYSGEWYTTADGEGQTEYHRYSIFSFFRAYLLGPYREPLPSQLPPVPQLKVPEDDCVIL